MKEWWERFSTATPTEKSRLKTAPTAEEPFMARDVDAIDMIVGLVRFEESPAGRT